MSPTIDLNKLKTSWTKYDIVRVMEVIYDVQTIEQFKNKKAKIDEPILKSFLGIKSISEPIPDYWIEIQKHPKEKKLFALFAIIFTHAEIINLFATKYSTGNMKGVFHIEDGKQSTNIRAALIESGAAQPIYRRTEVVPFDFSLIFQNPEVGRLFKLLLIERVSRLTNEPLTDNYFYEICISNKFHKAISLNEDQFKDWLEGNSDFENGCIEKIEIGNFFSVEQATINLNGAKEAYFLGENGDGKSLILMAMYLAFNGNYISEKTDQEKTGKASDIIRNHKNIKLIGIDTNGNTYNPQKGNYINNFFAYGTHRGRYSTDRAEEYGFMSLFDSEQTLTNPVTWLKDQKLLELEKSINTSSSTFSENSNLPNSIPVSLLEKMFYDLLEKNVEIKIDGNEVFFREKGTSLTFDQLSEGYKSIIIFVTDLLFRLSKNTNDKIQITNSKGIVLVDEIDLHLHPKWQRAIINKLRKLFPNIQFIFTTHSPTIIQGASEDSIIFRVYRNKEDGKTRVSDAYYRKNLDHLMINTLITSPLFGLSDSRMNPNDEDSDTSDTYLLYRINLKLEEELEKQKANGKEFISDEAIDDLIQTIINDELNKNGKAR